MKLLCVIGSMSAGGAQRVLAGLCNHWSASGDDVQLLTFAPSTGDFYHLEPSVSRLSLDLYGLKRSGSYWRRSLHRILRLRRQIRLAQPDVVLAFIGMAGVISLLATILLPVPVVVAEHTHTPLDPVGRLGRFLRWLLYRRAAGIIVLTDETRDWVLRLPGVRRVHVIPNALSEEFLVASAPVERAPVILAVGRLSHEKGFDLLIEAFSRVVVGHPGWRLRIAGTGPLDAELRRLASQQLPPESYEFLGAVTDIKQIMDRSAIFALSSTFEGFSLVLIEAMACGCAVVATDCPTGPRHIVRDGEDALLVPPESVDEFTAALGRLMSDRALRDRLGSCATQVRERYTPAAILPQWSRAFAEFRGGRRTA